MPQPEQGQRLDDPHRIPSEILHRITQEAGSQVVLVVGAGVSMEDPTGFRSGAEYSRDAHRKLLENGDIEADDCANPDDLSELAEAVYLRHNSQKPLTRLLPKELWRSASPNLGHLVAGALLLEGVVHHVITLNFDLAFNHAISELGNSGMITFVEGPDEHANLGAHSVVYLHRSANKDEELWVLRKTALDSAWDNEWESVVATANLSAPLVIFVGLGSPANVLTESVQRLAAKAKSSYYLVDRNLETEFANALRPNLTGTVQLFWCDFMKGLAERLAKEQLQRLRDAYTQLVALEPDLAGGMEDDVTRPLEGVSLVEIGEARSCWLLERHRYTAEGDPARRMHIAHLLLGLDRIRAALGAATPRLDDQGRIELTSSTHSKLVVGLAHGKGSRSWISIASDIRERNERVAPQHRTNVVVVAGARTTRMPAVDDLLRSETSGDLIRGADVLYPVFIDDYPNDRTTDLKAALERIVS